MINKSDAYGLGLVSLLIVFLSTIAILVNVFFFQYPGNQYFPPSSALVALTLLLMYAGFTLQCGRHSAPAKCLQEVMLFFGITALIALATNAAQLTPFATIDHTLVTLDKALHINTPALLAWTHAQAGFQQSLRFIYDTLPYQMAYIPLLVLFTKRRALLREYYMLLLISTVIGFTFYYFFPTTAPASVMNSPYFTDAQHATHLKFTQLHQHIPPTTQEGGLIALPSFHVIWAWFCLYLVRGWRFVFRLLLPINTLLISACVLLGWHYVVDVVGSLGVILAAHGLYHLYYVFALKRSPYCVSSFANKAFNLS